MVLSLVTSTPLEVITKTILVLHAQSRAVLAIPGGPQLGGEVAVSAALRRCFRARASVSSSLVAAANKRSGLPEGNAQESLERRR